MPNTSQKLTKYQPEETTLATLQQCTETKQVFNQLVKLEQSLTISESLQNSPLLVQQGTKVNVIMQIIRVVEFFLEVTGKELEGFQIHILAGDLYEKFKTDNLDDIIMMFKMARQGDFGKVYRCDTFEIMEWANKYLDVKSATREKLHTSQNKQVAPKSTAQGKYFHELPPEFQEKFNNIGKGKQEPLFLPRRATDSMTDEKHKREIAKLIEKDKKNDTNDT
jgi:hypothetical protein